MHALRWFGGIRAFRFLSIMILLKMFQGPKASINLNMNNANLCLDISFWLEIITCMVNLKKLSDANGFS